jgi:hypothetical protein
VGGVRLELVGHGSGLLFSVLTKKKPILAHFFKQTDRPSTVRVPCASRTIQISAGLADLRCEGMFFSCPHWISYQWNSVSGTPNLGNSD